MEKPVVCLGILVADVVGRPLHSIPDPGRLVLVDEMGLYTGGCAVNAASALAALGLPVEVIGKVGADPFGDFVVNAMQERGIGTRGVKRDAETGTSATMVMVDPDGERRFVHYIGANAQLTVEDVSIELVNEASIFHIGGSLVLPGIDGEPTAELLRRARAAGVTTFLDTVWDDTGRWMQLLEPSLPYIDYFIPSLPEAQKIVDLDEPGDVANALLDHGVGTVALKMGADGCLVMSAERDALRFPAFEVRWWTPPVQGMLMQPVSLLACGMVGRWRRRPGLPPRLARCASQEWAHLGECAHWPKRLNSWRQHE